MSVHAPDHLQTVAQARSVRSAKPKGAMVTRLEEHDTSLRQDEAKLDVWRTAVGNRDHWKDRFTGRRVERTLTLKSNQAHAHHHEPRANKDTRYDVRNGIQLSATSHARIKAGTLAIVAREDSRFYEVNGRVYLDVSGPVKFVETRP